MFALSARLEYLLARVDAIFDALVVAGLEVQRVVVSVTSPVPTIEDTVAFEKHGRGHNFGVLFGKNDKNVVRQLLRNGFEEGHIEVGQGSSAHERTANERVHERPVFVAHLVAFQPAKRYAVVDRTAPVAFRLFSLGRRKRCEEILERLVVMIVPMELAVFANEQPRIFK